MNAIKKSIEVRCSVETAFTAFTAHVDLWWPITHRKVPGSGVVLECKVGGRFIERAPDGRQFQLGEVIECEPPRHLKYTWYPGAQSMPTEVVVSFVANGDVTLVDVFHSEGGAGLGPLWPERAQLFERGWTTVLPAFKELAEAEAPTG